MNLKDVLDFFQENKSEQIAKIYRSHIGEKAKVLGISYANIYKIQKTIKMDHALALELWAQNELEAKILACMLVNVSQMSAHLVDQWVSDINNVSINHEVASVIAEHPEGLALSKGYIDQTEHEYICACGWGALTMMVTQHRNTCRKYAKPLIIKTLDHAFLQEKLTFIEDNIQHSLNRVKYNMNGFIIAVGAYRDDLYAQALETAKKIGVVEIIHRSKGCKTPDAQAYILKTRARNDSKKAKKAKP